jgi:uncharacterized membrane protein YdjX (TVP38/TMEM64 family)
MIYPFIKKNKAILSITLLLLGLFTLAKVTGVYEMFNISQLQDLLRYHWILSLLIFIFIFIVSSFIQIPGWILLLTAVLTYGKIYGGILTYISAIIACSVVFLSVNFIGKGSIKKINNKWANKILQKIDSHPVRSVILLRLVFQTAPPLNYSLALSNIKFKDYLIGTVIGLPLPISIYALFFENLLLAKTVIN